MAFANNQELNEQLLLSHEYGGLTAEAYSIMNAIINQRINKLVKFDKDIVSDAISVKCIQKIELVWHNYSFEQSNAFAYFVSVVDNVIKRYFMDNPTMLRIDNKLDNHG